MFGIFLRQLLCLTVLYAVFHLFITHSSYHCINCLRTPIYNEDSCETAASGKGFSQLFQIALFLAGMKVPCGRLPGLILCMEISWLPVPMTGRLLSGRKKMALGRRLTSTQGMIPQVCGVWRWKARLGMGEDAGKIGINPSVLRKKASIKQIGIN